jgi:hypothetical protein
VEQRRTPEGEQVETLTTGEARQAVTGQKVRYVLAIGCALAVVLMIVVYMFAGT